MEAKEFIRILNSVEPLKNNTRHSWTSTGRHESVAEHSWQLTLMAFFVRDEFPELDADKVMKMCLVHDIGEAFTGDVPSFEKTAADEEKETARLAAWVDTLPPPYRAELHALYAEMDALQTPEAKLYKALDNLEAVMQHNQAELSTWLPLEYTLQLSYGGDKVEFSPWLQSLKARLNADTRAKVTEKLFLKAANRADEAAEYAFLQAIPAEENGFYNYYAGLTEDVFRRQALPAIIAHAAGEGLAPGFVPETYFFLWNADTIVGLYKVRHFLNDSLREGAGHIGYGILPACRGRGYAKYGLSLAIMELKKMLLPEETEIYLSCNKNNAASLAVQQANGAVIHHTDASHYYTRIPVREK